ncbi:ferritin-like domain-containing protein [Mucidula mucida]|nr:ferritin-like domain-containing protein [Mucidula mucida]
MTVADNHLDTVILNYALTLEHLENAFYSEALSKYDDKAFTDAGLPSGARALFQQVAAHEQAHVDFLSKALGANATKPCTYKFPYTDPKSFAAVSQILEGVGVSAYAGAAQYITNPAYLTAAAVVLSTEARHASWVAAAVNDVQPWSGPLDVPLTLNQVYSLAAAFITSCPESNPALPVKAFPTLSVTPATGVKPGDTITIAFDGLADGMTAVFLTGLSPVTAPVTGGKVTVPKDLTGTVYLVITKGGDTVTDDSTSAGPAVFQFQDAIASSGGSVITAAVMATTL